MKHNQKGDALVAVILIGFIALLAVVSASTLLISEFKKNTTTQNSIIQYQIANAALENAYLQLLRNPSYVGETATFSGTTCYITVSSNQNPNTQARCTDGTYVRKIGSNTSFINGTMSASSIVELP